MILDITLSRWCLVLAGSLFLFSYGVAFPSKLQFHFRQRPFRRKENENYLDDGLKTTKWEEYAFSLEKHFTKRNDNWEKYKEFLYRWGPRVMGLVCCLLIASLFLNALEY